MVTMNTNDAPLRFGLVGTGYWATICHAPALASAAGISFEAVWGRNVGAAAELAGRFGVTACESVDDLLDRVDGVVFSVPPDVQSELAIRAARAGKHLLLEKPIALTAAAAQRLADAVEEAGVAALVFFTSRYQADVRAWLAEVADGRWTSGSMTWLGDALAEGNPFNTPWRRDKGALWDLGPHAVSLLWACLGPVSNITAVAGLADLVHLTLEHAGGATSTVTTTLSAAPEAECYELWLWGEAGRLPAPVETAAADTAARVALAELIAAVPDRAASHPCNVRFGARVVAILAEAQRQIDSRRKT
jgi:predicted dehydrogenase